MTPDRSAPARGRAGRRPPRPPAAAVVRPARVAAFVLAGCAAVFLWLDDRFGWLRYQPGGTAFFTFVRPVAALGLVLGALVALRSELGGAVISGVSVGAIGAFAVNQLVGWHAVLVVVLLAVPALLWLVADLVCRPVALVALGCLAASVAVGSGSLVGELLYERYYGPTHPESTAPALPESAVRWVWSGGVTTTSAEVRTRLEHAERSARLAVAPASSAEATDVDWAAATVVPASRRDGALVGFHVDGLAPDTDYLYAVEVDGVLDLVRTGELRTFPRGPASFTFTVGACARVGSNGAVFDAIAAEDPLVHLIAGDFHYGDIPDDDRRRYDEVIDLTLREPGQAALYRRVPVAYVWDDHDYGVDDADARSTSRLAAMQAYRANVPSYPLASETSPVYQSFDVGRVRFLLTDARSGREPGRTMLGEEQLAWFLDALPRAAEEQALVVWLNPVPWIADADPASDDWGGFEDERRRIADVVASHSIDNLLMVSGDAHMVAIDDGTNTDYSGRADGTAPGGAGVPLLHAAALDRPGRIKGGPYSEGAIAGGGQYGVVHVTDTGSVVDVELEAKRYDGSVLLSYRFAVPG